MTINKKNIFITGPPSSGKTTAVKKIIAALPCPLKGFYTEEERIEGKRRGFILNTLNGERGYLAHESIDSPYRIRRFGVSLDNVEKLTVPSIMPEEGHIIILDEIGKMECFSRAFREAALRALDSSCIVVGTVTLGGDEFIHSLKERDDMFIVELTPENRDELPEKIVRAVKELYEQHLKNNAG